MAEDSGIGWVHHNREVQAWCCIKEVQESPQSATLLKIKHYNALTVSAKLSIPQCRFHTSIHYYCCSKSFSDDHAQHAHYRARCLTHSWNAHRAWWINKTRPKNIYRDNSNLNDSNTGEIQQFSPALWTIKHELAKTIKILVQVWRHKNKPIKKNTNK